MFHIASNTALVLVGLAPGIRVEALSDTWAAYSPLTGDTLQLNAEAAAVLELLGAGACTEAAICEALAQDTGVRIPEVVAALQDAWGQLEDAGLIRRDVQPVAT